MMHFDKLYLTDKQSEGFQKYNFFYSQFKACWEKEFNGSHKDIASSHKYFEKLCNQFIKNFHEDLTFYSISFYSIPYGNSETKDKHTLILINNK